MSCCLQAFACVLRACALRISRHGRAWAALILALGFSPAALAAITITRASAPVMYVDAPTLTGAYVAYQVTSSTAVADVWVGIGGFTGGVVSLSPNDDGIQQLGPFTAGQTKTAYFFVVASGATATAQGHTVSVYGARPPGVALASQGFTLSSVNSTLEASANKVTAVVTGPTPAGSLGGTVTITVTGETGVTGGSGTLAFTPAAYASWRADVFELFDVQIALPGGVNLSNSLYTTGFASSGVYTAVYKFKAVSTTAAPTAVSPVGYISSGNPIKHTATNNFGSLSPVPPPVNTLTLAKSVSPAAPAGGSTATYTLRVTNSGSQDAALERLIDTLPTSPATPAYVNGSATWNGAALANPAVSGNTLTWSGVFNVPAGTQRDLSFQVSVPASAGGYTNRAVGSIGASQIDTTLSTADDAPATATFTIGPDITVAKSHSGSFTQGQAGSYTLTVTNAGNAASSGAVTVTDTVPAGMTPASASGTGWSCGIAGQVLTCTRNDALAAQASYPAITLSVNVALSAGSPLVNTASVTGGGDANTGNNSASDSTVVQPAPADLSVAFSGLPATASPGAARTGSLVCSNAGPGTAVSATCTASGTGLAVGTCVASAGTAASLPAGATLTCPLTLTLPGTAGGTDTPATAVSLSASTSASNDSQAANDSASFTVDLVDALNESASLPSTGGTVDLRTNDTVGASAASAANAVLAITGTLPTGYSFDAPTGRLTVTAAAAPGSQAIAYTVCAQPAPTPAACDSATATVTVATPPDMQATLGGVPSHASPGAAGTATLTCTNTGGTAATQAGCTLAGLPAGATVNCTPTSPQATLAAGASIVCSASFTMPVTGRLTLTGTASADTDGNAANDSASASTDIPDAADDSASLPASGGTVALLANDTLGNAAASTANVTVSLVNAGGLAGASVDGGGRLVVPSGTAAGTYAVAYRICATALNTACDNATATVTVAPPADMAAALSGLPTHLSPGAAATTTATCTNTGASPALNATCAVSGLPAGGSTSCTPTSPQASLAVGASLTCTSTFTVPASGTVALTVTTASTGDASPANNSASASAAVVNAVNDSASLPASGGTVALLANDTLGGVAATTANVTLSLTNAGGLAGASVDGSGRLVVPGGTAAGPYVLTYEICAAALGTACDSATATVTVAAPADMAATLTGLATHLSPGAAVTTTATCTNTGASPAVDASCTVSGLPAGGSTSCTPSSPQASLAVGASLTCTSTFTVPANGTVALTATTGSTGDASAANDTASASASVIDAVNDGASLPASGGTVALLPNDTLGGAAATTANVVVSLTNTGGLSGASVDGSGRLVVPAGTAAGNYVVTYRICATALNTACDSATATVTVAAPADMAVTLSGLATHLSPGAAATTTATCTNTGASPAIDATCTVSGLPAGGSTSCTPTSPQASLAVGAAITCTSTFMVPANGTVALTATTGSTGDASAANHTASASAAVVDAVADSGSVSTLGGTVVLLSNDTLGGVAATSANVSVSLTNPGGLTGAATDGSGRLVVPAGTPIGSYVVTYRICATALGSACDSTTATVTVNAHAPADMAVALAGLPTHLSPGAAVTTTATCTNTGGAAAVQATCAVSGLPTGGSTSCTPSSPQASLAVGASLTCTSTFTVPANGTVALTATTGSTGDASAANDTASASAAVVDAVNDSASLPATGGTVALLPNDTLGGAAATAANVTLSLTNTGGLSGASVDGSGRLVVPAGTAAASYVVTYRICATALNSACDNATATVTVAAPADMAVTLTGLATHLSPGAAVTTTATCTNTGASPAIDATCAVSGLPAGGSTSCTPSSPQASLAVGASLTCTSTFTVPANGTVALTATTGSTGDASAANDTASASASVIDAVNDSASLPASGGTVALLPNDTLGGAAATTANVAVSLTNAGGLVGASVDGSGRLVVPAGTAAGNYVVTYRICATALNTACDSATATVTVAAPADMAVTLTGLATHLSPGAAATTTATCTNTGASPAIDATCTVSGLPAGGSTRCTPASPQASLAVGASLTCTSTFTVPANGTVVITATAGALGDTQPANDTASVSAAVVDAVDDSARLPAAGGTVRLLANDTLGGVAATTAHVTVGITNAGGLAGASVDGSGRLLVPAGTAAGSYPVVYRLCATALHTACDSATATVVVAAPADMGVALAGLPTHLSPGAAVTVTATCTNTGASPATNAYCSLDGLPAGAATSCRPASPAASVAAGGQLVCSARFTAPAHGTVALTARTGAAVDGDPANDQAQASAEVVDAADDEGTVSGTGGSLDLAANDRLGSAPVTVSLGRMAADGSWPAGLRLDADAQRVVVAPGTADGAYALSYRLCATALPTACDTAVARLTVASADMGAAFSGLPTRAAPGQAVEGLLTCRNAGPAAALSAACTASGLPAGAVVDCGPSAAAPLAVGEAIACRLRFAAPGRPGRLTLEGLAAAANDARLANNRASASLEVADHRLDVVKAVRDPAFEQTGATTFAVHYRLLLRNSGASPVPNVQVADSLAAAFTQGAPAIGAASVRVSQGPCRANARFDGVQRTGLLDGLTELPPGAVCVIDVDAQVTYATAADAGGVAQLNFAHASGLPGGGPNPGHRWNGRVGPPTAPPGAVAIDVSHNSPRLPDAPNGDAPGGSGTPVRFPRLATLSGQVFLDLNGNGRADAAETPQGRFLVQALRPANPDRTDAGGELVRHLQAVSRADGRYTLAGIPAGVSLLLRFVPLAAQSGDTVDTAIPAVGTGGDGVPATGGIPVNGDPSGNVSTAAPGHGLLPVQLDESRLPAGGEVTQQNLPLDPTGIVYDSISRQPVAGATVELLEEDGRLAGASRLLPGSSAAVVTSRDGLYSFVFAPGGVGARYRLRITPPAGYKAARTLPAAQRPLVVAAGSGVLAVQPNGAPPAIGQDTTWHDALQVNVLREVVHNHVPLDRGDAGALAIEKQADRRQAEVGDSVLYRISVRNLNAFAAPAVQVQDRLPAGFALIPGSARLTLGTAATRVPAVSGAPGPVLAFTLGDLPPATAAVLTYRLRVGMGADRGDGVNRARATDATGVLASAEARARVEVSGGVFAHEACLLGKVWADCDDNGMQDAGEPGIPGVRLYLEDGTALTTDENGQVGVCGLRAITHVLKLDRPTLPAGSLLAPTGSRNVGDPGSLFIDPKFGELQRGDFRALGCTPPLREEIERRRRHPGPAAVPAPRPPESPPVVFDSQTSRGAR